MQRENSSCPHLLLLRRYGVRSRHHLEEEEREERLHMVRHGRAAYWVRRNKEKGQERKSEAVQVYCFTLTLIFKEFFAA